MRIVFDLDGTLCTDTKGEYSSAMPIPSRIAAVNSRYDSGDHVTIMTARGMGRTGDNADAAKELFEELTKSQLLEWGVKYHRLILGKPSADMYVDDKGVKDVDFFKDQG